MLPACAFVTAVVPKKHACSFMYSFLVSELIQEVYYSVPWFSNAELLLEIISVIWFTMWPLAQLHWQKWRNSKMRNRRGNKQQRWELCPLKKIYTASLPESALKHGAWQLWLEQPGSGCAARLQSTARALSNSSTLLLKANSSSYCFTHTSCCLRLNQVHSVQCYSKNYFKHHSLVV